MLANLPTFWNGLHWLLVRRSLEELDKMAAYLVFAPEGTLFETMVAGRRWTVEESLELSLQRIFRAHLFIGPCSLPYPLNKLGKTIYDLVAYFRKDRRDPSTYAYFLSEPHR